ncbi:MAG: UDP-N-acetylmuramoyl-L-alanine--D-glutamate ligase [Elusimicrobiota bacterium]
MKNGRDLSRKRILVLGMADSGLSACRLLLEQKADVTAYDIRSLEDISDIPPDIKESVRFECGRLPEEIDIDGYDRIITSPGISPSNSIIKRALSNGIGVISELELGVVFLPDVTVVAVTGTNGKTTTCELIWHIAGGILAGNIGCPLTSKVSDIKAGSLVILEVSSYQAVFTPSLIPDVGIVLNLFPEHIDWHGSAEDYYDAKKSILKNQSSGNTAIVNYEIENVDEFVSKIESKKIFFSSRRELPEGVFMRNGNIVSVDRNGLEEIIFRGESISLPGTHNRENLMAVAACWKALGNKASPDISGFKLGKHRLEKFAVKKGVTFINDSKATNMDSTLRALESIPGPIILLMGGRSKHQKHPDIRKIIKEKVSLVIAFGESRDEITAICDGIVPLYECKSFKEAVVAALKKASAGDTVLLSPGGSSFDEFNNYCERGDKFKIWIEELAGS